MNNSLTDFSAFIKNGVLDITDCGIYPGSIIDNKVLESVAQTASKAKEIITVHFPTGEYRLKAPADSACGIDFAPLKLNGVVFDGAGSTLIMTDNFKGGFGLVGCQNITFKNFLLKYESVPWFQATITDINKSEQIMTVVLDDEYTVLDDPRFDKNITSYFGIVRNSENPKILKSDVLYYFFLKSKNKISEQTYNIQLSDVTPLIGTQIFVGDKVVINNRVGCDMSMFNIIDSGYMTFENITIHSCACTGIVGRQLVGPLNVNNFRIEFPENSNQWVTSTADGIHIQAGTHPVTIENSYFCGMMDDGVNLYQWRSLVSEVLSEDSIILRTDGGVMPGVGQTIEVFDAEALEYVGSAEVLRVEDVKGEYPGISGKLILKTPISGIRGDAVGDKGHFVFVKGNTCPGSVIRNNTFCYLRGRGLVLCSSDTLVENNYFNILSNHAIHGWYGYNEGFGIHNMTISNNHFDNIGFYELEANSSACGTISIRLDDGSCEVPGKNIIHHNIVIQNNTIKNFNGIAINTANCENLVIEGNEIILDEQKPHFRKHCGVEVSRDLNVEVKNNRFINNLGDSWDPIMVEKNRNLVYDNNVYECQGKMYTAEPVNK